MNMHSPDTEPHLARRHRQGDVFLLLVLAIFLLIGIVIGSWLNKSMIRDEMARVINDSCRDYGAFVTDKYRLSCEIKR